MWALGRCLRGSVQPTPTGDRPWGRRSWQGRGAGPAPQTRSQTRDRCRERPQHQQPDLLSDKEKHSQRTSTVTCQFCVLRNVTLIKIQCRTGELITLRSASLSQPAAFVLASAPTHPAAQVQPQMLALPGDET